jgi:hypothetical protein
MGIEDIRRGWEEIFDIGARITLSVRLDGLPEETEDLLIQSLAMRDGAWRHCEEDDMFPTVLKVYVKGKLVDHKSYDE